MPRKASGSRLSSTACRVSQTVAAISGRLIQKIARQEVSPIRAPPPAGPITVAIPVQAVQVPTALPRAAPSKVAATIANDPGTSNAPAIPCKARAAIKNSTVGAELAKSHFFDSLGLGLTTLNSMLDLVNNLAEDFGKLPEG